MTIQISELHAAIIAILLNKGLNQHEAEIVAESFVRAECSGKKTHGIAKLFLLDDALKLREGKPEIIKDKFNYALIDAHKELGYLSADFACDILIDKAQKFENAFVGVNNSYYFAMTGVYAEKVARAGFVSIMMCGGGPAAVTPVGGADPILGTNPIAIGIPTPHGPIVLDMATSAAPWGEINLAKTENRALADKTFVDAAGAFTTDPARVEAIIPFGGHKGAGLNFMLEILSGALVHAKMGLQTRNGYDLGFFFMAFSSEMFSSHEEFDAGVAQIVADVKNSRALPGVEEIFVPGEQSQKKFTVALQQGVIEIDDDSLEILHAMSHGEDVKAKLKLVE